MAGIRDSFGGNIDLLGGGYNDIRGRAADIGRRLDSGLSMSGQMIRSMKEAGRETRRLKGELSGLQEAQRNVRHASEQWQEYQRRIDSVNRSLAAHRRANSLVLSGVQGLEKAFGRMTKGLISFNTSLLGIGFNFLINSIKRVYELQERWTKAIGGFNMSMGGMTKGLSGATKAATQWSGVIRGLTNGDIQEGIQMFTEFTEAMSRTVKAGDGFSKFGLQLARGFNLGGKGAGDLSRVLEQIGNSSDDATELIGAKLVKAANAADVPVNMLAKDISETTKYLARFGKEGQKTFVQGAAYARKFTISMNQLQDAMQGLDMFDEAAQTAAKLNTVFGTMINSMDLMMADDPAERIEMIRQQFLAQGKTFDTLTPKQRRYLAETTKLGEDQIASLLSLKNANVSYADFKKAQERSEQQELNAKKAMDKQLRATAQTMYAFGIAFDRITIAIGKAIKPLLQVFGLAKSGDKDFKSFGERMESITVTVEKFFESLSRNEKWNRFMVELANDLKKAGSALADFVMDGRAADLFGDIADGMRTFYGFIKDLARTVVPALRPLIDIFFALSKHLDKIVLAWGAFKGVSGLAGMASTVGGFTGGKGAGGPGMGTGGMGRMARGGLSAFGGTLAASALGGTHAAVGGAIGSMIGAFVPVIGPFLGVVGAAIGKGIEKLFSGPKVKSTLEQSIEDLTKSQKDLRDATDASSKFMNLMDAKKRTREARDEQSDRAVMMLQNKKNRLSSDEKELAVARLEQLKGFAKNTGDVDAALTNLKNDAPLTQKQFGEIRIAQENYKKIVEGLNAEADKMLANEKIKTAALQLEQNRAAAEVNKKEAEEVMKAFQGARDVFTMVGNLTQTGNAGLKGLGAGIAGGEGSVKMMEDIDKMMKVMTITKGIDESMAKITEKQNKQQTDFNKQDIALQKEQIDLMRMAAVLNTDIIADAKAEALRKGEKFDLSAAVAANIGAVSQQSNVSSENLHRLYKFAGGGVVTRPTRALIGEAGPEAVIPLRAMAKGRIMPPTQHGGAVARQMMYGAGGQTRVVTTVADVNLDGRKVGSAIVKSVITSGE